MSEEFKVHDKIYDDVEKILGENPCLDVVFMKTPNKQSDEKLKELNNYAKKFLKEQSSGIIKTMLVNIKPYRENEIIKDTYQKLFKRLKIIINK